MLIQELLEKFQGILSEEDIKATEDAINTLIQEASEKTIDSQIEELVEVSLEKIINIKNETNEANAKEFAAELKCIREADAREAALYIKSLTEAQAIEVAEFITKRESEITESLEAEMVSKIDTIIDGIVAENFTDDMAEKIAINETYGSIVEGMQHLLSAKLLNVDSEGYDTLKESKDLVTEQEAKIKSLSEDLIKVAALVESVKADADLAKAEKLILEKTQGLSDSQKKTINLMCESINTSMVSKKIDIFVESVLASENENVILEEEEVVITSNTLTEDILPLGKKYISQENRLQKDTLSAFKRLVG